MTEWSSIHDLAPEELMTVLLWDGHEMTVGFRSGRDSYFEYNQQIKSDIAFFDATHWMPMPSAEELMTIYKPPEVDQ